MMAVSDDIECDTDTCDDVHAEAVTVSESITVSLDGSTPGGEEGNAIFTAGVSFSWVHSKMTTDTFGYHPHAGTFRKSN